MKPSLLAAPLRRRLTVLLCVALAMPLGMATSTAQESSAEGHVAYSLAAPDGVGGYTLDGLAATDLEGADFRRLTFPADGSGTDRNPRWSPDGRWLAFTRQADDVARPMVVAAAGGDSAALAEEGWDPSWAPDGSMLIWATDVPTPAIVVADVVESDPELVLGDERRIELPGYADGPVMAPEADAVAFRMRQGGDGSPADLWTINLDGTGRRRLTRDVDLAAAAAAAHSWSPDGTQIVFLAADAVSRGNLRAQIVNTDGSEQRLLFPSSGCEYTRGAAWAPHGEFLAVLQSCQAQGLKIVTPEGKWLGDVGTGPRRFGGFEFSADGADLYAAALPQGSSRDPYNGQLHRIPLDGSTPEVLATDPSVALEAVDVVTTSPVEPRVVTPPPPDDPDPDPEPEPDPREARPRLLHACPVQEMPYADFLDVELDSPHRRAIDCLAWWELVSGVAEYQYGPAERVSRAQMATLLARLIEAGGVTLSGSTIDYFDDDGESPHERNINRLAKAGIIKGDGQRRFRPGAPVRRDQMASLVVAAYGYVSGVAMSPASQDYFTDDGHSVHHGAINLAAEAGFVAGVGDDRYAPDREERRDQAATRGARILDALVQQGQATPPREGLARVTRVVDGDTVLANDPKDGTIRIRVLGINAMEKGTCGARDARLALRDLVLDKTVRLSSTDASSIGARQRPLRFVEVYGEDDWIDVNAEQLRQGHALWFPKVKEPDNSNAYQLAVREAMAGRLNVWDPAKCGRGPQQRARVTMWVQSNPPGPDANDLNGEWVRIHNTGDVDLDLAGWWLRDSSLRPAYRFVGDSMLPVGATMVVHVGSGTDGPLVRYWGLDKPLFANARRVQRNWIGDGAYLLDRDGDIRFHFMYPCIGACPDPLLDNVKIATVVHDPPGDDNLQPNDEYVRLRNISDETVSLYGYQLRAAPHTYHFPEGSQIGPGAALTVRVGHGRATDRRQHWGNDTAILDDVDGRVVLRTYDRIRISCWAWGAGEC